MTLVQHCISCGGSGHTYLSCPLVDFGSLICGAMHCRPITGQPLDELVENLEEINASKVEFDKLRSNGVQYSHGKDGTEAH